jgi:5-methyltetrahydrofolate--homocysteine methyltransferase
MDGENNREGRDWRADRSRGAGETLSASSVSAVAAGFGDEIGVGDSSAGRRRLHSTLLANRIAVLDGAMGTMVHALALDEQGFRGRDFRDSSQGPEELHRRARADAGGRDPGHPRGLPRGRRRHRRDQHLRGDERGARRFRPADHVRELNLAAARLAREAADAATAKTPDRPRFVAGSIGPTNKQLSIAGNVADPGHRDVTFDQMVATYREQIEALLEGGVDLLLAETAFDTLVLKSCLYAIEQVFPSTGIRSR